MSTNNGKTIYQLTSADALKDTDLFAISSADNLTRSVTLQQIRLAVNSNVYNKTEVTNLLDELRLQIKEVSNNFSVMEADLTEFRNEFNNKLQDARKEFNTEINSAKSEFNTEINKARNEFNTAIADLETRVDEKFTQVNSTIGILEASVDSRFTAVNQSISNLDTTLSKKITDLDTKLTNQINGLISYGTAVPTTLAAGKVYLQYF